MSSGPGVHYSGNWKETAIEHGNHCQDGFGNRKRCYGLKPEKCSGRCDVQDFGYDCEDRNYQFVVICVWFYSD